MTTHDSQPEANVNGMTDEQKAALEWLDTIGQTNNLPFLVRNVAIIKAMLGEPRMPEVPTPETLSAMNNGYWNHAGGGLAKESTRCIYAALREHLSKPATKVVEVWRVEWAGDSGMMIDWTKPLRVVGTHEEVTEARMPARSADDELPVWIMIDTEVFQRTFRVDRCGRHPDGHAVENIPPEPRIVEGWTIVMALGADQYAAVYSRKVAERERENQLSPECWRLAKLLIEEDGT